MASKLKTKTKKTDRITFDITEISNHGYRVIYAYGHSPNRKYTVMVNEPASFGKLSAFLNKKLLDITQPKKNGV